MAHLHSKTIIKVVISQLVAVFIAWFFAVSTYNLLGLVDGSKAQPVGLSFENAAAGWVGFVTGLIFLSSVAHFLFFSRLKIYFSIVVLVFLLLGFSSFKLFVFILVLILAGFLVGSAIRIGVSKLKPRPRRAQ